MSNQNLVPDDSGSIPEPLNPSGADRLELSSLPVRTNPPPQHERRSGEYEVSGTELQNRIFRRFLLGAPTLAFTHLYPDPKNMKIEDLPKDWQTHGFWNYYNGKITGERTRQWTEKCKSADRISDRIGIVQAIEGKEDILEQIDAIIEFFREKYLVPKFGGLTHRERQRLFKERGGICCWCWKPLRLDNFTIEHLTPRVEGGADDWENYDIACDGCNNSRSHDVFCSSGHLRSVCPTGCRHYKKPTASPKWK